VLQNDRTGLRITRPIPRHLSYYRLYDLYIPYIKFSRNNQSYDELQNVRTGLWVTKPILGHKLYRVVHKSVKYFKNSQQIDCARDHGNSYVYRERNC